MITSLQNDKVKLVRALQARRRTREKERRFVFEGVRLVEETVHAGVVPDFVFYTLPVAEDARGSHLLADLEAMNAPCYEVSEEVMDACADTETPQGILAVLPWPDPAVEGTVSLTLILDQVRDPGNLGTIMRTALAAGVDRLWLVPGTVDFSNPKVVRSAMGAHLHLPVENVDWGRVESAAERADVWLADVEGQRLYTDVDWTRPVVLIIGGEARGAGPHARALADRRIRIPLADEVESLNTAAATAVILFERVRQRRLADGDDGS